MNESDKKDIWEEIKDLEHTLQQTENEICILHRDINKSAKPAEEFQRKQQKIPKNKSKKAIDYHNSSAEARNTKTPAPGFYSPNYNSIRKAPRNTIFTTSSTYSKKHVNANEIPQHELDISKAYELTKRKVPAALIVPSTVKNENKRHFLDTREYNPKFDQCESRLKGFQYFNPRGRHKTKSEESFKANMSIKANEQRDICLGQALPHPKGISFTKSKRFLTKAPSIDIETDLSHGNEAKISNSLKKVGYKAKASRFKSKISKDIVASMKSFSPKNSRRQSRKLMKEIDLLIYSQKAKKSPLNSTMITKKKEIQNRVGSKYYSIPNSSFASNGCRTLRMFYPKTIPRILQKRKIKQVLGPGSYEVERAYRLIKKRTPTVYIQKEKSSSYKFLSNASSKKNKTRIVMPSLSNSSYCASSTVSNSSYSPRSTTFSATSSCQSTSSSTTNPSTSSHSTATSSYSSESDSSFNVSLADFVTSLSKNRTNKLITKIHRKERKARYYTISYSQVERRVKGAPLIEKSVHSRKKQQATLRILKARQKYEAYNKLKANDQTEQNEELGNMFKSKKKVFQYHPSSVLPPKHAGLLRMKRLEAERYRSYWLKTQVHQQWKEEKKKEAQPMSREVGREKKKISKKNQVQVVTFDEPVHPSIFLGPGRYSIEKDEERKGIVAYDKAVGRNDIVGPFGEKPPNAQIYDEEGDILELSVHDELLRPRVQGFTITSPLKTITSKQTVENEGEILEPNYQFGKKSVIGFRYNDFGKQLGHIFENEKKEDSPEALDLTVNYTLIERNNKIGIHFDKIQGRISSSNNQDEQSDAFELNPKYNLGWEKVQGFVDMGKQTERWEDAHFDEVIEDALGRKYQDAEYDIDQGLKITSKYGREVSTIAMSKQMDRWTEGSEKPEEKYKEATYSPKMNARSNKRNDTTTIVDMDKGNDRWDHDLAKELNNPMEELNLDVKEKCLSTHRRVSRGVNMTLQKVHKLK